LKRILAFILSFALLGQTLDQGWYYLGYLIEKKEYVKRCENKNRPQMNCFGQCQLMKKMKKQQEKDQEQLPELKLASKSEIGSPELYYSIKPPSDQAIKPSHLTCIIGFPIDRSVSLFHPPDFA